MTTPKQDKTGGREDFIASKLPTLGDALPTCGNALLGIGKKFNEMRQVWMASVAIETALHGNTTEANRVIKALDELHIYTNGMKAWFESKDTGAPFKWNSDTKTLDFVREKADKLKARYEKSPEDCYAALKGVTIGKVAKEPEYQGFDLRKVLKGALKRADDALADPSKKGHKDTHIDEATLASLRALVQGTPATATTH